MNPNVARRISWRFIIWGTILMAFGGLALGHDHFNMTVNGVRKVITRQNNPGIYWGACLGPFFVGAALCTVGVYLMRKPVKNINPGLARRSLWYLIIWSIILMALGGLGLGHHYLIHHDSTVTANGVGEVKSSLISLLIGATLCATGVYLMRKKDN